MSTLSVILLRYHLGNHGWRLREEERGEFEITPAAGQQLRRPLPPLALAPLRRDGRVWWQWASTPPVPIAPAGWLDRAGSLIVSTLEKNTIDNPAT